MYICGTLKKLYLYKRIERAYLYKISMYKIMFSFYFFVLTSHGKEAYIILTLLHISELYFPIIDIAKLLFESKLHFIFFSFLYSRIIWYRLSQ